MATVPTKWFSSTMGGAPSNSGSAGALISVLDGCFVNGFGTVTLDSLVVSANVATLTKSAGHGFLDQQVIEIAGATPAALNGQWRFTRVSSTSGTFAISGISDQTASGTITAKTPPLGWTKAFSGTNKAAYKLSDPGSTGAYLRVDDTGTTTARARGYVAMSSVDAGTDPFPTDAQVNGGGYWVKSNGANSTAHEWLIAGDGSGMYVSMNYQTPGTNYYISYFFGDSIPLAAGDGYRASLSAAIAADSGAYFAYFDGGLNTNSIKQWFARNHLGASGAVVAARRGAVNALSGSSATFAYPSPMTGGLVLASPVLVEQHVGELRGAMPGLIQILNNAGAALAPGTVISGVTGTASPVLLMQDKTGAANGLFAVSLGPWR